MHHTLCTPSGTMFLARFLRFLAGVHGSVGAWEKTPGALNLSWILDVGSWIEQLLEFGI